MNAATTKQAFRKAYKGLGMEGFLARWYATNTRKSLAAYQSLAQQVAAMLPAGSRVLEVAPGPGYFAIELAKLGSYRITGLDISPSFVAIATRNAEEANVAVDFRLGSASCMPLESESFDFLLCRAAFKNFSEPVAALQEMHRVLKPGGQGLIIDLRKDASPQSISRAVDDMGLNVVNKVLTKLTFRFMLLKRAYTENQFREFFAQTGFQEPEFRKDLIGLEIRFRRG